MTPAQKAFIKTIEKDYPEPTLSDIEIGKILRLHRQTIYRMRLKGKCPPFYKCGKHVLCLKQDFYEWFFSTYSKLEVPKNPEE